ncbi:MAG TPA: IPT/TIG domain-containing protein [Pilimelia sp.]|nr:IPT/TIG domain-containing protein [Pilimelia sp.]
MRGLAGLCAAVAVLACAVEVLPGRAWAAPACGAGTVTVTRVSGPTLYLEPGTLNSAYAMYKITNTSGAAYPDLWVEIGSFAGPAIGLAPAESGRAHPGGLANGASTNAAFYLTASTENLAGESHRVSVYPTRPDLAAGALCQASFSLASENDIAAAANKVTSVTSSATPQLGGRLTITVVGDTGTIGAAGRFTATPASYASWPADAYRLTGSRITMSGGNTGVYTDVLHLSGLNPSATDYTAEFTFAVVGTTASSTAVSPMTHISSGTQVKHTTTSNFGTLPAVPRVVNNTTLGMSADPGALPPQGGTATYTVAVTNAGAGAATLDDVVVTLPAGVTYLPGSATFGGSPTADPRLGGGAATFLAGLTVPAGSTRALTLQVGVPGTPGQYAASAVGHIASVVIDATTGTGDSAPPTAGVTVAGPPPTLTSISPGTGPAAGGTAVTITGTGFTGVTDVRFGNQSSPGVTVTGPTQILAVTPPGSGTVDVTVVHPNGTSAVVPAGEFTYQAPPTPPPAPAPLTSTGTGTAPQTAAVTVPSGGAATLLDDQGDPTAAVTVSGQGSYALSGATITFTPVLGFAGQATAVTYRVTDQYQQHGDATYTPTVQPPAAPDPPDSTSSGVSPAAQSTAVTVPAGGTATLLDAQGDPTGAPVTVAGQGTYSLSGATITFAPQQAFTGQATPVTYRITDAYGQHGDATYTPTVTAGLPAPPQPSALTSTGTGPAAQTVTVAVPAGGTAALLDTQGTPTAGTVTVSGQGSYLLSGTTITFTPVLGFTGAATAVGYRVTDAHGQYGDATYTPTVDPPAPPAAAALTSTGQGTAVQTVAVAAPAGGTVRLLDAGTPVTTLTVARTGVFTVTTAGLAFTPAVGHLGPAVVSYRVTDAYQQPATATYTATVTAPPPPSAPDRSTRGVGTTPQSTVLPVPPGGTVTLLDARGRPATRVTFPGKGTYRLQPVSATRPPTGAVRITADPAGARIEFTAALGYKGTAPAVTYRITDAYGQTATATYTPTVVLPAPPAPPPQSTTGQQTDPQRVTLPVPAGGSAALVDRAGRRVSSVTIPRQGTYTLDSATGVLVFTPLPDFTGRPDPVTYQLTDAYGQTATATYSPAVTGGQRLPVTGSSTRGLILVGLLLVLAGALAVGGTAAARRTRTSACRQAVDAARHVGG